MTSTPERISEQGLDPELRRKVNQILEHLKTLKVRESATVSASQTQAGVHLEVKPSARGGGSNNTTPRWG